ncbi:MAG: Ig-like domain-containing protein [Verrucomicrobia bacterium]|nr:Ig-like domain-containing protein [Verrucomicrobiota bacterium]MBI3868720.1 Ig-like domain-containing protein [Verrucomicrobiota bacterium]
MKTPYSPIALRAWLCGAALLSLVGTASSQPARLWEAFNDHHPNANPDLTSPNATGYSMRVNKDGGILRDIQTGEQLAAGFFVSVESDGNAAPDDFGADAEPDPGSPADLLFKGKVDIGNDGLPGLHALTHMKLILNFYGLDPDRRYDLRGTVCRGGSYDDRWSVFSITGAENYVAAHVDGSKNKNLFTKASFPASDLQPNQVALNTGHNKAGSLVGWDNIEPVPVLDPDGNDSFGFQIVGEQYGGVAPFGNPAAGVATKYGYGLNALYLAEVEASGNLRITENPENIRAAAGKTAKFSAAATSTLAITYQWQKSAGGADYTDIPGATSPDYTTPALNVAEDGTKFRCSMKSGADHTTTGEATLTVDGVIPTVVSATASIHFNSIYVAFSEAMKLEQLPVADSYKVSGGVKVNSAVVLDPSTVRLITSDYGPGTALTVTVSGVEDLAGNSLPADSKASFKSFSLAKGFVGFDLWKSIVGGLVSDLRNSALYPDGYDVDYPITGLDSTLIIPSGPLNAYGARMRTWITPTESGDYEFFLDADEAGEVRISLEDDTFDSIDTVDNTPIATDATVADGFKESGAPSTSAPITLEAGHSYPLQVIYKEVNGGDFARVAWRLVGDATPAAELQPISGDVLSYYGPTAAIQISAQPDGKLLLEWGGKILESSDDLLAWTEETGLTSPATFAAADKHKFYRTR